MDQQFIFRNGLFRTKPAERETRKNLLVKRYNTTTLQSLNWRVFKFIAFQKCFKNIELQGHSHSKMTPRLFCLSILMQFTSALISYDWMICMESSYDSLIGTLCMAWPMGMTDGARGWRWSASHFLLPCPADIGMAAMEQELPWVPGPLCLAILFLTPSI